MTINLTQKGSINYIESGNTTVSNSVADIRITNIGSQTSYMTITTAGNVGIGTTAPSSLLELGGGYFNNGTSGWSQLAFSFQSASEYKHFIRSRHDAVAGGTGNALDFYINNSASAGTSSAPGTGNVLAMTMTAAGIGIGTGLNTVRSKLDINGALGSNVPPNDGGLMQLANGSEWFNPKCVFAVLDNGNTSIQTVAPGAGYYNMLLNPNGGNIGIRTTSPDATLDVVGTMRITSGGLLATFNSNTVGALITTGGNVGIGTTAPSQKLESTGNIRIKFESTDNDGFTHFGSNNTTHIISLTRQGNDAAVSGFDSVRFYTNSSTAPNSGTLAMRITSTGSVGIGTSSPSTKFHIQDGTAYVRLNLGTSVPANTEHGGQLILRRAADAKSLVVGVLDSGHTFFQANESGVGYYNLLLNPIAGNVGIGTSSPSRAKLEISGSVLTNIGNYGYLNGLGGVGTSSGTNNYSIYVSDRIAAAEFDAFSDIRIKEQIQDINDASALNILRQIEPKRYNYIDKVSRGPNCVWGFIAQQVESVLDYATNRSTEFVPNIYETADVNKNEKGETNIVLRTSTTIGLTSTSASQTQVKIKLYIDLQNTEKIVTLKEIVNDKTFIINEQLDEQVVFVYGIEVFDFHTLNKDAIFTINVAATQEIDRDLQQEKQLHLETKQELEQTKQELASLKQFLQSKFPGEF